MSTRSGTRSAVGLTEVLLAFALIGAALIPTIGMIDFTSKSASNVSFQFRESVLAQLLLESIKGRLELDPWFLDPGHLEREYGFAREDWRAPDGTTVQALILSASMSDAAAAESTMARNLPGSSFLTDFLFNHTGGALYAAENRDSLKDESRKSEAGQLADLRRNFRDLAFRVVITDGCLSAHDPTAGTPAYGQARSPFTRRVRVEIKRVTPGSPAFDPADLALELTLQTPAESLPLEDFKRRQADTDDYSYEKDVAAARASLGDAVTSGALPPRIMDLLEDVYLVMSQATGEAVRTEGDDLGFGIDPAGKGFQQWIRELEPLGTPYARMKSARLEEDTMVAIMRAFRRSERPIREVILRASELRGFTGDLTARIQKKKEDYDGALNKDPHRDEAQRVFQQAINEAREMIFWVKFFEHGPNLAAFTRPMGWRERFRRANRSALDRRLELRRDDTISPLNQVKNLKYLLESSKAMTLMENMAPPPSQPAIAQERLDRASSFLPLSQYLSHDDLGDPAGLRARNEPYLALCAAQVELLSEGGPYAEVIELVRPGGTWRQQLDSIFQNLAGMQLLQDITAAVDSVSAQIRQTVRQDTGL